MESVTNVFKCLKLTFAFLKSHNYPLSVGFCLCRMLSVLNSQKKILKILVHCDSPKMAASYCLPTKFVPKQVFRTWFVKSQQVDHHLDHFQNTGMPFLLLFPDFQIFDCFSRKMKFTFLSFK